MGAPSSLALEQKKATGRPVAKSQSSELKKVLPEKILICFLRCSLCHHRRTGRTEVPHLYSSPFLLQISIHLSVIV